jgi:hypothetical protein
LFHADKPVKNLVLTTTALLLTSSFVQADGRSGEIGRIDETASVAYVAQDGMSLSQAVESVRRRANVERVVSAKTEVENGREVHYIRYMTKDGKVKTARVAGRRR